MVAGESAEGSNESNDSCDQSPSVPEEATLQGPTKSSKPSQSYVYPVRSLLSGIQRSVGSEQVLQASTSNEPRFGTGTRASDFDPLSHSERMQRDSSDKSFLSVITGRDRSESTTSERDGIIPAKPVIGSESFEGEGNDDRRLSPPTSPGSSPPPRTNFTSPAGSSRQSVSLDRGPEPLSTIPMGSGLSGMNSAAAYSALAQGGYVHLGPLSSSPGSSKRGSVKGTVFGSDSHSASKGDGTRRSSELSASDSRVDGSGGDESANSQGDDEIQSSSEAGQPSGEVSARSYPSSLSSKQQRNETEPYVSFRFEHVETEDGHHVITGRDGKILKCEDEPIRVPGAVQGFGVLIAVEDDQETGNLVVRQVSENSTELLGLSPRYLFSLECFTATLPDSQADLLWDNIQFLTDPELNAEAGTDDSPQVFLLSGWGEPGSGLFDDRGPRNAGEDQGAQRRSWTCWCAVHQPAGNNPATSVNTSANQTSSSGRSSRGSSFVSDSPLIVLEFELERDIYNPLYPPIHTPAQMLSSDAMPSFTSSSESDDKGTVTDGSTSTSYGGSTTERNNASTSTLVLGSLQQESQVHNPPAQKDSQSPFDALKQFSSQFMSSSTSLDVSNINGLVGVDNWFPSAEDVFESTTNRARPLRALERMRRMSRIPDPKPTDPGGGQQQKRNTRRERGSGVGTMDVFAVLSQVNEQLSAAQDLDSFLKIVVGVIKDLTQFHRVLIYQFDEHWNGQVVAELVDWNQTHDLYNSLHFPASDIPAQARELYAINKVRLLYDRSQPTARLVVRSKADLDRPLDLTHSFLRAMSPIHVKYLGNMGVRASMSISIVTFGALWGLIACHSYGDVGMRVSFPVRQMLRLLSDSVSRNIERLSYAQRLHTRKLISTLPTDQHPTGYIITNAEDLLGLFDADFGVLVIGDGAKILGPNQHGQEILIVSEYLRLKQFTLMQVSQSVGKDFPDLQLTAGMDNIAGLLYVPLTSGGKDFIAFLRKGQLREVHWAGKPFKEGDAAAAILEPRKSFKMWSETVAGRCRAWTDEQLETAGVLALVYGKFIEVWRQKESALQTTQLTNLLLSNASHEVRTPLNHIINYLEMALSGPLDSETRENLMRSHAASKGLLFTINDLLDLTRLESGNETSFNEPFNLQEAIQDAVHLYSLEAKRRGLEFKLDISNGPSTVIGDAKKIRTVVSNLTANAVKYTTTGSITIECRKFTEPKGLRGDKEIAVEIVVADTGCGMESSDLENIFREFEQVESSGDRPKEPRATSGLGLGLAVVARIIEQVGGQLRVDSKPQEGSRFSFLIPFATNTALRSAENSLSSGGSSHGSGAVKLRSRVSSEGSAGSEIENLVDALSSNHMSDPDSTSAGERLSRKPSRTLAQRRVGEFEVEGSKYPVRSLKMDEFDVDKPAQQLQAASTPPNVSSLAHARVRKVSSSTGGSRKLRVLVVEDDNINRTILSKRLKMDGHDVVPTTNGLEGAEMVERDRDFDAILMDIQMPILNGFQSTERIRAFEAAHPVVSDRLSIQLNKQIPIFAVSASLREKQHEDMSKLGLDGWILKPIDFKRLRAILIGIHDTVQRRTNVYHAGYNWESGGWLREAAVGLATTEDVSSP